MVNCHCHYFLHFVATSPADVEECLQSSSPSHTESETEEDYAETGLVITLGELSHSAACCSAEWACCEGITKADPEMFFHFQKEA